MLKTEEEIAENGKMNVLDHLEELRRTLIRCAAALVIGCVLAGSFLKVFVNLLNWPIHLAMGEEIGRGLVTTSPMAVFSVVLQVCFLGGFALALPFMLYFVAQFVTPGLTDKERSILKPGCILAFVLFLMGATFSYFVLLPTALRASLFLNQMFDFQLYWSADRYYGLLVWMVLGIGVSFEFPLLIVLLVYTGVLNTEKLRAFRPYSIVMFLTLAAVMTPTTDPFTFFLLAVPMSLLYEIALWIARRVEQSKMG